MFEIGHTVGKIYIKWVPNYQLLLFRSHLLITGIFFKRFYVHTGTQEAYIVYWK